MIKHPPLTIGIEEEFMIIDPNTRALTTSVSDILEQGRAILGDQIKAEFMQSQVEVGSVICNDIYEARADLTRLRRTVSQVALENGKVMAAAATHPFSRWHDQHITDDQRYDDLRSDMREVAQRLLIFGLHIHLGFGDDESMRALTIDIMNQMRYFLPHILALTTSSPFWHSRETGLKSYRSVVFESLPRTGIPPIFNSYEEYDHFVALLGKAGSLGRAGKDATKIWWDVRPNPRIGTLEIRVSDMCTTIDEAICVAAVIQSLAAKLIKLRANNQSWRLYRGELIKENKWRAARYGIEGSLIDFGSEEAVPVPTLWSELLEFIDDVVPQLGTRKDVEYVHTILKNGTSADRQIATYRAALAEGCTAEDALIKVTDRIIAETQQGI
ncbi:MAG: carboxylate-amine ligase [Chloroflexota bacterium]